jgi:hypothetical protein
MIKLIILIFFVLAILTSCTSTKIENINTCPPCPIAGKKVAIELEKVCDEQKCKNTIEWLQRYEKVCDILKTRQ